MTIREITSRKEDQTFDCKKIQIELKGLAISIVAFTTLTMGLLPLMCLINEEDKGCGSIYGGVE